MKLYDLVIIGSGTAAQVASSRVSSVLGRRHACGPPERVRTILEGGDVSLADAKYEAELKAVTKKHGFRNFAEYEAVAAQFPRRWPRSIRRARYSRRISFSMNSSRRHVEVGKHCRTTRIS
jgi:hypothetical protein